MSLPTTHELRILTTTGSTRYGLGVNETKQAMVFAGQVHFPILDSRLISLAFSFVQSRSRS